jgi:deoxyribonuclease-4
MIKFGPSGNSESFYAAGYSKSEESAVYVKNSGLEAFEYSFGRGVNMGEAKAITIGNAFKENNIELSVHATYYINFANTDEEFVAKSYNYVLDSAKSLNFMQGTRCIFHCASQGKAERSEAFELTKERIKRLTDYIYLNNFEHLLFCPETMGKIGQIGTVEEIIQLCKIDKIFIPAIDFGHINAREQGSLKTKEDYMSRLLYMISELSYERMKHFHIHFSKIEYSAKGEVRHLTFEDTKYGPEFEPLAICIKELKLEPVIISESAGTQLEDAIKMKETYNKI